MSPQPPHRNQQSARRPGLRPGGDPAASRGPLSGLRVLDLTAGHPGALTTVFLGDYGADVIKVVPAGDLALQHDTGFLVWNRNKRAVRATADGVLESRLALSADVVVETTSPGVRSPGPDYSAPGFEALRGANPGLVWCSITPYGPDGPLAARPGYEGVVAARSGIMTEQRGSRGEPVYNALPIAGIGAALLAIQGILAALHRRAVTGLGQRVETSVYQGSLAGRSPMLVRGEGVQRWDSAGNDPQGALPNYRLYRCGDGRWLHLGTLIPVFWNKLIIALDLFEFATDPRFETAPLYWPTEEIRAEAKRILATKFETAPRDHWLKVLREGDVPASPAMETADLFEYSQVGANGLVTAIDDPHVGRLEQGTPPVRLAATPGSVRLPAPASADAGIAWDSRERAYPADPALPRSRARRRADSSGPLAGIRVLDLSSYLAGPIGPAYLADLGADVVKVEPLEGEGCRMIMMLFLGGNPGKRGVALDLKKAAAREVLRRLVARSDVVVHNYREGVAERLGIDYDSVRAIRRDVIYLQSTAYGSNGPDARLPGFDPLFQSLTGIAMAQAGPGRPPVFPKTPICDIATAMLGAAGVLLALAHRDRTGEGQLVETSLLATGLWLRGDSFVRYPDAKTRRVTNEDCSGLNATYRWYRASDGYLFVACCLPGEFNALLSATGVRSREAPGEGTVEDLELTRELAGAIGVRSVAHWLAAFQSAGVPAEKVAEGNDEGVYENPQARHLRALDRHPYPGFTKLVQPGVLVRFSDSPAVRTAGSPLCGQHTAEVLSELGYSGDEIAAMERERVIAIAGQ